MKNHIINILASLLLIFSLQVKANTNKLNYQHSFRPINVNSGLSNSHVYSICEDATGYIWVGTEYGLNRLNSTSVSSYYSEKDNVNSLPSNLVYEVILDKNGVLWVATDKGLCKYNARTDDFDRVVNEVLNDNDAIYNIKEDLDNNLWLASEHGLLKYDVKQRQFYKFNKSNTSLEVDGINNLLCLPNNYIWISLLTSGIKLFDKTINDIVPFDIKTDIGNSIEDLRFEGAYIDKDGNQWFGTLNDGAYRFRSSDSVFVHYTMDPITPYSTRVRTFFEDSNGDFYAGTRAGIYILDKEADHFESYANSSHLVSKLSHNSVITSFIDDANGLWLGTYAGGVNYANLKAKKFISYEAEENDVNSLNNGNCFVVDEDEEGNIYVGTEKGINILNVNSMKFDYIVSEPNVAGSLSYSDVKALSVLKNGDFWAGTNNGGLNYYSKSKDKFKVITEIQNGDEAIDFSKIYTTYIDERENLWTISFSKERNVAGVLSYLEKGSNKFRYIGNDFSYGITSGNDQVYIGAKKSFWKFSQTSGEMQLYKNDSILGDYVYSLYIDENNNLWIGSSKGLALYNFVSDQFIDYSFLLFKPAYSIYSIVADDLDNLWVSSNHGLMQINGYKSYDRDSITVDLYTIEEKLPSNEFNINSGFKSASGDLYFGTKNGLLRFNPSLFPAINYHTNLVFTRLEIDGSPVYAGDEVEGNVVLTESLNNTKSINISYASQLFSIYFDALQYANPQKSGFIYKLEGFDKQWKTADIYNNKAIYTNLPSGHYTFKIYASYNQQKIVDTLREIEINIAKPFWETWWFYIAITVLLGLTVLYTIEYRTRRFLATQKELQKAVDQRTLELNNANVNLTKLKQFGEEVTAKLDEREILSVVEKYLKPITNINIIGLAMINDETNKIDFINFRENGKDLPPFTIEFDDSTSITAYAVRNNQIVVINDMEREYKKYISSLQIRSEQFPRSLIFVPLKLRKNLFGVLTIQSYKKNEFNNEVVNYVQSLLTYINISIDNANAYNLLKRNADELIQHKYYLEDLVEERTKTLEIEKNKAEESDRLKSAFLANMSHEIRTPLNAIIGFLDVLDDDDIELELKHNFHKIIQDNAYTLLQLINDIIDFSKIEANQIKIQNESVNLQELLDTCYLNFNEQLKDQFNKKNSVELKLQNYTNQNVNVLADRTRLMQVINNLISNALKFTEEGSIEYGIFEIVENEYVMLYVKDTGIGIDEAALDNIFQRFFKVEGNIKNLYRGTGLGLAISKHLMQLMNGEISVESELGKGSIFKLKLPLSKSIID